MFYHLTVFQQHYFIQLGWSSTSIQEEITPVKCGVQRQWDIFLICHGSVFGLKGQPVRRQRLGVAYRSITFRPRWGYSLIKLQLVFSSGCSADNRCRTNRLSRETGAAAKVNMSGGRGGK